MDCKLEQPLNAPSPIVVTLSGISMNSRLEQPLNAQSPIEVTLSGIMEDLQPAINFEPSFVSRQLSADL